ncbi:MAG: aldolase [Candidatus Aenigmarchaeota archaeon]|nr:aldolase [Candidatus Aenigmarchaeota archaeon]
MELKLLKPEDVLVPCDVPQNMVDTYIENFLGMTHNTGKLMLFAGDQRIEHAKGNKDFCGDGIAPEDNDPEHLFRIAKDGEIGVFAAQPGLITRYAMDYKEVPYLVKMNSKTNFVKTEQDDPYSSLLIDIDDIVELKNNAGLNIPAVGYTVYLGSEYEDQMITESSNIIRGAHKNGMLAVLWIYPRGAAVTKDDEKDPHSIAGAAGYGASVGADFVKLNYPSDSNPKLFKEVAGAAGRTGVVFAGGSSTDPKEFLERLYDQIYVSEAIGNATGRNLHQKPLDEAIMMCDAISAITLYGQDVNTAMEIYEGRLTLDNVKKGIIFT